MRRPAQGAAPAGSCPSGAPQQGSQPPKRVRQPATKLQQQPGGAAVSGAKRSRPATHASKRQRKQGVQQPQAASAPGVPTLGIPALFVLLLDGAEVPAAAAVGLTTELVAAFVALPPLSPEQVRCPRPFLGPAGLPSRAMPLTRHCPTCRCRRLSCAACWRVGDIVRRQRCSARRCAVQGCQCRTPPDGGGASGAGRPWGRICVIQTSCMFISVFLTL